MQHPSPEKGTAAKGRDAEIARARERLEEYSRQLEAAEKAGLTIHEFAARRTRQHAANMAAAIQANTDRVMAARGYTHVERGHGQPDGTIKWEKPIRLAGPVTAQRVESRNREHQPAATRRDSSSSRTSSDPPSNESDEPPAALGYCECCTPARPNRFCACGCGREITHKRADATTFGASCRQKLSRAAKRDVCHPLEPKSCQCESGFFYRDPEGDAVCGLCGCWIGRVGGPVTDEHPDYYLAAYLLYTNHRAAPREVVSCS